MSQANRISQLYNSQPDLDLSIVSQHMVDEISLRIMEFVRTYDPTDVTYMPHVFPTKLERWTNIIEKLATRLEDPAAALETSVEALSDWTREYKEALDFDWDYQTWRYIGNSDEAVKMSMFEAEKNLYVARGISNPDAALSEAIDQQKKHGLQARDTAVSTFCKLAKQYPAEGVAALDAMPQDKSERLSNRLSGVLDLQVFKAELSASIPQGYTPKAKRIIAPSQQPFF